VGRPAKPAPDSTGCGHGQGSGVEALAAAFPYNAAKPSEFGAAVREPAKGQAAEPAEPSIGGSTLSETNASPKVGSGNPQASFEGFWSTSSSRAASRRR